MSVNPYLPPNEPAETLPERIGVDPADSICAWLGCLVAVSTLAPDRVTWILFATSTAVIFAVAHYRFPHRKTPKSHSQVVMLTGAIAGVACGAVGIALNAMLPTGRPFEWEMLLVAGLSFGSYGMVGATLGLFVAIPFSLIRKKSFWRHHEEGV